LAGESEFYRLAGQHFANGGGVGRQAELLEHSVVAQQACPQTRRQATFGEISQRVFLAPLSHLTAAAAGAFRNPAGARR
jgi:hypothetical protein